MIRILYFAWLRGRTGVPHEQIELPEGVATVDALTHHVAALHPRFGAVLAEGGVIRAAVNHEHAGPEQPVRDGDEVAFFPPVTGG